MQEGKAQTLLIITGVALGVGVIVFMSALVAGMQANIIRRTLNYMAPIVVIPPDQVARPQRADEKAAVAALVQPRSQQLRSIDQWQKARAQIERLPDLIAVTPVASGPGFALRGDATAQGGYLVTKEMIAKFLNGKKGSTIVVQGFGNAGLFMAEKLYQDGFKVIAVSDSRGGIYNENGLDIDKLAAFKNSGQAVGDWADGEKITNAELLELKTNILVLAALENQITEKNAANVKADYIIELANGPVTYEADKILAQKKIIVVPDILANSGGVIVSYFEWAQNRTGQILDEEYLRQLLEKKMKTNWQRVYETFQEHKGAITLRQAAYILAIKRVLAAEKLRGRI